MKTVYLDHAATSNVPDAVVEAMLPFYKEHYANASGNYSAAHHCRQEIEECRKYLAETIGAKADEIYFTSGGSEADNWALKGIVEGYGRKGRHIITTNIEHPAVKNTCEYLKKQGCEVTYIPVNQDGQVTKEAVERAIRRDTILISIMFANNEIGVIQPIEAIGRIAERHGIVFHVDAVQAYGQVPIHVGQSGIHLMSVSGHKFGSPKGIGFLYVREGIRLESFMHGGSQESGRRAGTENVAGIVGMTTAAKLAMESLEDRQNRICGVRDYFAENILRNIPYTSINGTMDARLPNNVNICFKGISAHTLLGMLDQYGIYASGGSACSARLTEPSRVLLSLGLSKEDALASVRFTLGEENTKEDMDYVIKVLQESVIRLRNGNKRGYYFWH